jgi:ATP-binding cassette subfamily F protein uup
LVKKENTPQKIAKEAKKFGFKEKFRHTELEKEIKTMKAQKQELEKALEDPHLYEKNVVLFTKKTQDLEALRATIESTEEEWLNLEILKEEAGL